MFEKKIKLVLKVINNLTVRKKFELKHVNILISGYELLYIKKIDVIIIWRD